MSIKLQGEPTVRLAKFLLSVLFMIGIALPIFASLTLAQNSNIVLSLTAPEWMQNTFNDELFGEFEAQNPGVDVVFTISGDNMYYGGAAYDAENFFDNASEYAQLADVLMWIAIISPLKPRAGRI
jgi:ABC-type glycerol-3-phosphate transport system substrate-binding protein